MKFLIISAVSLGSMLVKLVCGHVEELMMWLGSFILLIYSGGALSCGIGGKYVAEKAWYVLRSLMTKSVARRMTFARRVQYEHLKASILNVDIGRKLFLLAFDM
jgi:hypothetical protein